MVYCESITAMRWHDLTFNRKYLSDPTEDVRVATETLLADFLREIRDVSVVRKRTEEQARSKRDNESIRHPDTASETLPDLVLENSEHAVFIAEKDDHSTFYDDESSHKEDFTSDGDYRDSGGRSHQTLTGCRKTEFIDSLDSRPRGQN